MQRKGKHRERMDEVIESGGFPIVNSSGLGEPLSQSVGPESSEGDSEKKQSCGEADAGGGTHGKGGKKPWGGGRSKGRNRISPSA